jgi:excisionase family DNA binding protein
MVVPRRHPRRKDTSSKQLTLADWEREQALDALLTQSPPTRESLQGAAVSVDVPAPATRSIVHDGFGSRQLLTVAEVGQVAGLSTNAVYRAIASGELRASKLRGRLRVLRSDVDAWIDAARVPASRLEPPRRGPAPKPRAHTRQGRGLRELLQPAGAATR